jgi:hypothetical protein
VYERLPCEKRCKTPASGQDASVRRTLALGVAATLAVVAAPGAAAHVTAQPSFVAVGAKATVSFEAPNERDRPMTSLELVAPAGVEVLAAEAPPGWRAEVRGGRAEFSGGRLAAGQTSLFPLRVRARGEPGTAVFDAVQRFDDGAAVRWEAPLTLVTGSAIETPDEYPGRALLAAVVGVAVIASSLMVLRRTRRRTLQEG